MAGCVPSLELSSQVSRNFISHLELRHRCDYAAAALDLPEQPDLYGKSSVQMGVPIEERTLIK